MTFKDQLAADLENVFYNDDEFAEFVDFESADGNDVYPDIPAIVSFGEGDEYRGSDESDTEATIRIRVSDMARPGQGWKVSRGVEEWTVLDAKKSADNLEWIVTISRITR